MHNENYTTKSINFTFEQATHLYIQLTKILLVVLVIPFFVFHFKLFVHYFSTFKWMLFVRDFLLLIVSMIIGIILHELIHGLTWALFVNGGIRAIKFGFLKKYLTPYCHCKGYLKVRHYIAGAVMPAIILGILPTLWAFINGSIMIFFLGVYFIVAASGDFLIIFLLRSENFNSYVKDHESLPGCIVYKKKDA